MHYVARSRPHITQLTAVRDRKKGERVSAPGRRGIKGPRWWWLVGGWMMVRKNQRNSLRNVTDKDKRQKQGNKGR